MHVVAATSHPARQELLLEAMPPHGELRFAATMKELTDLLLRDETDVVVLDTDHPKVDPLEAVRLVKGTRWDVRLVCIGDGDGAERARRAGASVVPPSTWHALRDALHVPDA